MKKLFFIIPFLFLFALTSVNAQRNITIESDADAASIPITMTGADTVIFAPSNYEVKSYSGVVGFQITYTSDTLKSVVLQGSQDNAGWTAVVTNDKDAGTYWLKEDTPEYWYYRLFCATAAADTVTITKVKFVHKE